MTKWLLLYKGDFTKKLKGPEIRYIKIAEQLVVAGNDVTIAGACGQPQGKVKFVTVHNKLTLLKAFLSADVIMLHGGGPFILLLALISRAKGKRVLLDNYAPHWLELFTASNMVPQKRASAIKIAFNLFRTLFGIIVCDAVIAANKRQQDLYRGLSASSGNLHLINKIKTLSYGAEPVVESKTRSHLTRLSDNQINDSDILIGWIGGLWDWFDYKPIVEAISAVATKNENLRLVFFGVDTHKTQEIKQYIASLKHNTTKNFVFLPWIEYKDRLEVWSGLDAGIVWANQSIENDYAARTRNYDCISARLPIIQNWDDHWGPIIKEHQIGITTSEENLKDDLTLFISGEQQLKEYSDNIASLYDDYSWQSVTSDLLSVASSERIKPSFFSIIYLIIVGPFLLLNVLLNR